MRGLIESEAPLVPSNGRMAVRVGAGYRGWCTAREEKDHREVESMARKETIQQANRTKRATMDMFKVKRDGAGNLIPVDRETDFGIVSVIPMTYGDAEEWGETMGDEENVDAHTLAKQFKKHIVEPDMSEVTGNILKKDFKPLVIQELLMAIIGASGLEDQLTATVNADGTAKVTVDEGN